MRFKVLFSTLFLFLITSFLYGRDTVILKNDKLEIIKAAYPDVEFEEEFDFEMNDWKVTMTVPDGKYTRTYEFYLCNGSLLPVGKVPDKDKYWSLLYDYKVGGGPEDPRNFSEDEIEAIKDYAEKSIEKSSGGTPMFFFDALYDARSKNQIEKHMVSVNFLGKKMKVHKRIREPLDRVDKKIKAAAKEDEEIKSFIENIRNLEGYYWRVIAETERKSFHSLGIAVDILPKKLGYKAIYWNWTKQSYPDTWMKIPLKGRWMPPQKVIDIFEEEGFIWGGKWAIWDNMHFEYHPELILKNK